MTGSVALRPNGVGLLPRVLGLYIAAGAGAIQLMDILVDRVGMDDRAFAFFIVVAALGIPVVCAGTIVYEAATAERRAPSPPRRVARDVSAPVVAPTVMSSRPSPDAALGRQLELVLSLRRIAGIQREAGASEDARRNEDAFRAEAEKLIGALNRMLEETTSQSD